MTALLEVTNAVVELGGRRVVDGVDLSADRGEIVALLGPNGAGKSSLIRAALGLLELTEGRTRLYGADPALMAPDLRARRAAYLPQKPVAAWPLSVAALVALGRYAHGGAPERMSAEDSEAVEAALAACSLSALRARRLDEISGGERVRAHLARTLAHRAPLLVLDEPTAGLDPAQTLAVADILRTQILNDGAVLFSTHDIALAARAATRIVLLRSGRVIATGTPREALTPAALQEAYGRPGRLIGDGAAVAAVFE